MNWQIVVIRVVLAADFLIFGAWVIQYARVYWRETRVGKHLMLFAVVLTCLLGLTLLRALLGPLVFWLWLVGLIALGGVGVHQTILLRHYQRKAQQADQ